MRFMDGWPVTHGERLACRHKNGSQENGALFLARIMSERRKGMNSTKQAARIAGVLYLVNGVTGFFSIIYFAVLP
jgi:hypothetical protein